MCRREAVSAGHYLGTQAAMEILAAGGNAVDAGVAAGLVLSIVESCHVSLGGVAPIIIRMADAAAPVTIAGLGTWPRTADIAVLRGRFGDNIPRGVLRTVVPAAPAAWIAALRRFGTMPFADVAGFAIDLARNGFPVTQLFHDTLENGVQALASWPSSAALYLRDGALPTPGTLFFNADAAAALQHMADEERTGIGRDAGLQRARDAFYKGEIARKIADFIQSEGGLLDREDLAAYDVEIGDALSATFEGVTVYGCGPWCQGPMLLQMLKILDAFGLHGLAQNSPDYLHVIAEVIRLACWDRERYYGDPNFVDVPMNQLLSDAHARTQAGRIRRDIAMPPFGHTGTPPETALAANGITLDTSYVAVVDRDGNAFSATPSDGCTASPVVPGLGFIASSRGGQSWTDPAHPSALAPGKRPRLTPNPAIAVKPGEFVMPFGTPGHDAQSQVMLQAFLNLIHFGMSPQDSVTAPRIISLDFPSSAVPHAVRSGLMFVEEELGAETRDALRSRGHDARYWPQSGPDHAENLSCMCMVRKDYVTGVLSAAADPRRPGYAMGR